MSRELLFRKVKNALIDLQGSTYQTFEHHFLTFARLISDSSLEQINEKLVTGLDIESFLNESYKTQGGMVGSATLVWPVDPDEVLGLKWLLIQELAREPHKLFDFAHTFYHVGRNITGELHSLNRQLLIPFARDYQDYVMMCDGVDVAETNGFKRMGETPPVMQQTFTYNLTGANARVNHHSTDNSFNVPESMGSILAQIQKLRDEVQVSPLSEFEKIEVNEVVDELEAQVLSGKPKKTVMRALIDSLPTIESISVIGKNLFDLII